MRYRFGFLLVITIFFFTVGTWGDVILLRDGIQVEGTFLGGDSRIIRVLTQDGQVANFPINEVKSISFGELEKTVLTAPRSPRSDVASAGPVTVPKGTVLVIQMIDSVDSDKHRPGDTFRATLKRSLTVEETEVAPEGAPVEVQLVHVKQSGTLRGEEEIALQVRSITIDGNTYTVASSMAELASEGKGEQTAKVVGGTAAIGAIIGAVAGGKKGAAVGAATGAGAGVAVQAARGKQVRLPSEAVLSVTLQEALVLN